ncbi:hypothetical protein CHUAL_004076 [Chamberlinius hualienensis]
MRMDRRRREKKCNLCSMAQKIIFIRENKNIEESKKKKKKAKLKRVQVTQKSRRDEEKAKTTQLYENSHFGSLMDTTGDHSLKIYFKTLLLLRWFIVRIIFIITLFFFLF